jgi:hypothetical protein
MKRNIPLFLALALTLAGCGSSGGNTVSRSASDDRLTRGSGPASDLAALASGNYRLAEPSGDLQLRLSGVGGTGQTIDLFVRARGTAGNRNVSEEGVLRLASEGPDVRALYIPHFDATISELSPNVTQFTEAENLAACSIVLRRDADGWEGDTEERGTCVRAIGSAVGRWRLEIRQNEIRFASPDNQDQPVLVFRKG